MKKTHQISLLSIAIFLLGLTSACETDFDIAAEWKEITVIYGLLSLSDNDQHYIKVQKAFLGEKINAFETAQIADSLYHEGDVSVKMNVFDSGGDPASGAIYDLQKVDAAAQGINQEEGIFGTDPYLLYAFNQSLDATKDYQIQVTTPQNNVLTATTAIVNDFDVRNPSPDKEIDLGDLNDQYILRWKIAPNTFVYDLDISFNYEENRIEADGSTQLYEKTLNWDAFSNKKAEVTSGTQFITHTIKAQDFFDFLLRSLTIDDPDIKYREFVSLDFIFNAGSEEFKRFNDVALAQAGVTAGQVSPEYTNIEGEGLGLFSSRYQKTIQAVPLSRNTIDELGCGNTFPSTGLKFRPSKSNSSYPGC